MSTQITIKDREPYPTCIYCGGVSPLSDDDIKRLLPPPEPSQEDKIRAEFEEWLSAALDDKTGRYSGGEYASGDIQWAWAAWQAAREGAGTPEPVDANEALVDESAWQALMAKAGTPELADRDECAQEWGEFVTWLKYEFGKDAPCAHTGWTTMNLFTAFRAGKAKGGAQ